MEDQVCNSATYWSELKQQAGEEGKGRHYYVYSMFSGLVDVHKSFYIQDFFLYNIHYLKCSQSLRKVYNNPNNYVIDGRYVPRWYCRR